MNKANLLSRFLKWLRELFKGKAETKKNVNEAKNNKFSGNLNQISSGGSISGNINIGDIINIHFYNSREEKIEVTNFPEKDKESFLDRKTLEEFEKLEISNNYIFSEKLFTLLKETKKITEWGRNKNS